MKRSTALRVLAAAAVLVVAWPGDAHAIAHIEGGGAFTAGSLTYSPALTPDGAGGHTATLTANGLGAAWHLTLADTIAWDCDFELSNPSPFTETYAAGAGVAVGGCVGVPQGVGIGTGNVTITCPQILSMAYTRVGNVLNLAGVCFSSWTNVGDLSDVTMTFLLGSTLPDPYEPAPPISEFTVVAGAFRYRG